MPKTEWKSNKCYFCGSSTPNIYADHHNVVTCKSCNHIYMEVPRHIPVDQVKRYFQRVEWGKVYNKNT